MLDGKAASRFDRMLALMHRDGTDHSSLRNQFLFHPAIVAIPQASAQKGW